jgi:hypothetical protein
MRFPALYLKNGLNSLGANLWGCMGLEGLEVDGLVQRLVEGVDARRMGRQTGMHVKWIRGRVAQIGWWSVMCVFSLVLVSGVSLSGKALAGSMYSYVNEEGATVITDDLKKVPERYRKQVKVTEVKGQDSSRVAGWMSDVVSRVKETVSGLDVPFPEKLIPGLTNYQSAVLIGGFVVSVLAFAMMTLFRNPGVKFAMKWVLMFVVVGTVYALYFSELDGLGSDGSQITTGSASRPTTVIQRVKIKAKDVERGQQRRADELDRLGAP